MTARRRQDAEHRILTFRPASVSGLLVSFSYNPAMAEPDKLVTPAAATTPAPAGRPAADADKVLCERCGAEMFRMHAVWRCPACRYKTDCCGW